jgi:hypothetical protein
MIVRKGDIKEGRVNLCPDENFLQCAALCLPKGTTFKAHRHIPKPAEFIIPEESWHVVSGSCHIFMYDTDGAYLDRFPLHVGDTSFTFSGAGHNYEIVTDDFKCLEYKVGPYLGIEADKIFI